MNRWQLEAKRAFLATMAPSVETVQETVSKIRILAEHDPDLNVVADRFDAYIEALVAHLDGCRTAVGEG